ncbi:TetR family transcriptional regulator [Reticulibacter mediterranei]|uniref:TetR family transcriptional regulator n=1 Tax=Reticulibacter mediterranei TaxID=2778369 RepID=A0A8J3IQK6_9CHLR|nr:TetR/AcrR family transcriptional regulator [Reticulibacter mediterranei]GHP00140.1 TetR family transcriptional regulator [Reticulibacter mediterranei]
MKQQKADRRSQRTYRLVNAAFAELVVEKPYDEILVQDILDRAGIGRTTFYAHYFDKEDVLNTIVEQELELLTRQIAHAAARQRVVPSLELFEHAYHSENQQFRALMRSRASEFLWEALQAALCRAIEPALCAFCTERRSPPIPLPVVSQYLAGAFLTLLKWWVEASQPYPPEQMETIFQQLALPGVWAMLKEK